MRNYLFQDKCLKPCGRYRENCSTKTAAHNCPLICSESCLPCDIKVKKERKCGHMNNVPCNEDVNQRKCTKPCRKMLECGHKCRTKCSEPCGNCKEWVEKAHELCGHKIKVRCCEKPDRKNCKGKCPLSLPCGHPCQEKCNVPCSQYCNVLVDCPIKSPCGHTFKIPCGKTNVTDPYSYEILKYCREPCGMTLNCLHPCSGNCGSCAQGRIHKSCQQSCEATLICGHPCEYMCRETCRPCQKKCTYSCIHSKCGKKCGQPCSHCKEPCRKR